MCNDNPFFGKDIYLVGGGNSFNPDTAESLPSDRVVCLNSTYNHFSKMLALFYMDGSWYRRHKHKIKKVDIGHVYHVSKNNYHNPSTPVKWLKMATNQYSEYPKYSDSDELVGNNIGCCTIHYLDKMKARRIYLLGFDCKKVEGKSHSHGDYRFSLGDHTYNNIFLPCFRELSKNLKNVTVYNCYAGSAIKNFKYKSLSNILREEAENK